MNFLKWLVIVLIIAGGIVANLYYAQVDTAYRATVGIFVAALALSMIYTTDQGKVAWAFAKSARTELRKVVWPTRQEVIQTALVVVAMVVVTTMILWAIDTFFMWFVVLITGQRG